MTRLQNPRTRMILSVLVNLALVLIMLTPGSATDGFGRLGNYANTPENYLNETLDLLLMPQFALALSLLNLLIGSIGIFLRPFFRGCSFFLTVPVLLLAVMIPIIGQIRFLTLVPPALTMGQYFLLRGIWK